MFSSDSSENPYLATQSERVVLKRGLLVVAISHSFMVSGAERIWSVAFRQYACQSPKVLCQLTNTYLYAKDNSNPIVQISIWNR